MSEVEIIDEPVITDEPLELEIQDAPVEEQVVPPTPKPKPKQVRKKAVPRAPPQEQAPQAPAIVVDADFWGELLATRRELDRTARTKRFENLVKF